MHARAHTDLNGAYQDTLTNGGTVITYADSVTCSVIVGKGSILFHQCHRYDDTVRRK